LHWPNVLHADSSRNEEVIDQWVTRLRKHDQQPDAMLSPDTAACWTQLAYRVGTDVSVRDGEIEFDFSRVDKLSPPHLLDWFTIKVEASELVRASSTDLEIKGSDPLSSSTCRALKLRRARKLSVAKVQLNP